MEEGVDGPVPADLVHGVDEVFLLFERDAEGPRHIVHGWADGDRTVQHTLGRYEPRVIGKAAAASPPVHGVPAYVRHEGAEVPAAQFLQVLTQQPACGAVYPDGPVVVLAQEDDTVCAAFERCAHELRVVQEVQLALYAVDRRQHDGQGVVVDTGGVSGHIEAADYLAVHAVYRRGGAGPAVVSAAIVLRADHLYGRVAVERDAYRVGADAEVRPERPRHKAQALCALHDGLVPHRRQHIARAVRQDHEKARPADDVEHALHDRQRGLHERAVCLAYGAEHSFVHAAAQSAVRVHAGLAALLPALGHGGLHGAVQPALVYV